MAPVMVVNMPLRTARGGNNREHWSARHRRVLQEREATGWYLRIALKRPPKPPLIVVLTRITPAKARGLDDDNLTGSLKSVRDAIAEWIGVDDSNLNAVRYEYRQELGGEWGVRIEVHRMQC